MNNQQQNEEKNQRYLPLKLIFRLMKSNCEKDIMISRGAQELVEQCTLDFINFVCFEANDIADKQDNIRVQNILQALENLGFDEIKKKTENLSQINYHFQSQIAQKSHEFLKNKQKQSTSQDQSESNSSQYSDEEDSNLNQDQNEQQEKLDCNSENKTNEKEDQSNQYIVVKQQENEDNQEILEKKIKLSDNQYQS